MEIKQIIGLKSESGFPTEMKIDIISENNEEIASQFQSYISSIAAEPINDLIQS